jgi:hypothetical protein
MRRKRIDIAARPAGAVADDWIRSGNGQTDVAQAKAMRYTARLTIDVTPELRARIKVLAFRQGVTVADMLRSLLGETYAERDDSKSPP